MKNKFDYLKLVFNPGCIVIYLFIGMIAYGAMNTILLNRSQTFEKAEVSQLIGTRRAILKYYHPKKKKICYCGGGRVVESTSKIGKVVIIRVHPFWPSICSIDWKKTREYKQSNK